MDHHRASMLATRTKTEGDLFLAGTRQRLAEAIRRRPVYDQLDVDEVARTCGSTRNLVQRVAQGEVPKSLESLLGIALALGVKVEVVVDVAVMGGRQRQAAVPDP